MKTRTINIWVFNILFFIIFLVAWINDAGTFCHGLYSDVDGQLFAWYAKALVKWSGLFDTLVLNPFQGMVSTFLPYGPWWNPGALALSLPLSTLTTYIISYSIYWFEVFVSIYLLARTIKLTRVESVLAAQIFVLLTFAPFTKFWVDLPILSIAPLFSHLVALANFMLILYLKLGFLDWFKNSLLILLLLLFAVAFFMSGTFIVVTYLPIYAFAFLGATFYRLSKHSLLWKILFILCLISAALVLGVPTYYKNILEYSTRSLLSYDNHLISFSLTGCKSINVCAVTGFQGNLLRIFCPHRSMISFFYLLSFFGGIIGLFRESGKYRWLAYGFLVVITFPDILMVFFANSIVTGRITGINPYYYGWAAFSFVCIFFVIFISFLWENFLKLYFVIFNRFKVNVKFFTSSVIKIKPSVFLILTPLVAGCYLVYIFQHNPTPYTEVQMTKSIQYLHNHISLELGGNFRGSTASYFVSENSSFRKLINPKNSTAYDPAYYIHVREILKKNYGNMHMFSDLWQYNIPTIEEYGQMVTIPMFAFFQNLLAGSKGETSKEKRYNRSISLAIYKLNLKVLSALGVRYILTDELLTKENISFVLEQKPTLLPNMIDFSVVMKAKEIFDVLPSIKFEQDLTQASLIKIFALQLNTALHNKFNKEQEKVLSGLNMAIQLVTESSNHKNSSSLENRSAIKSYFFGYLDSCVAPTNLYLYEVKNPNLASFSPTRPIKMKNAKEIFSLMNNSNFSFEKSVVLQEDLPNSLSLIKKSNMKFERNGVRIQAESDGWSLLLLPLQYSNCLNITSSVQEGLNYRPRLIRANIIQTAILFQGKIDVNIRSNFGVGRDTNCRRQDIIDMENMEIENSYKL